MICSQTFSIFFLFALIIYLSLLSALVINFLFPCADLAMFICMSVCVFGGETERENMWRSGCQVEEKSDYRVKLDYLWG
jgi:hypothetical protein